jgi:hypothetical protein
MNATRNRTDTNIALGTDAIAVNAVATGTIPNDD